MLSRPKSADYRRKPYSESEGSPRPASAARVIQSSEELNQNLARLYFRPVEVRQKKKISDEAEIQNNLFKNQVKKTRQGEPTRGEAAFTAKLYYNVIENSSRRRKALEDKHDKCLSWKGRLIKKAILTDGELVALAERLSKGSMDAKARNLAITETKLYPTAPRKVLSKQQLKQCSDRLSSDTMRKRNETMDKAMSKYNFKRKPCKKVLSFLFSTHFTE